MAKRENLLLLLLARIIDGDHNTEDNTKSKHNNKTNHVSWLRTRLQRFQEICLGKIKFMDSNSHRIKTYQNNNLQKHQSAEHQAIFNSQKDATKEHVLNLDVTDIYKFAKPISWSDEDNGYTFDFHNIREHIYAISSESLLFLLIFMCIFS